MWLFINNFLSPVCREGIILGDKFATCATLLSIFLSTLRLSLVFYFMMNVGTVFAILLALLVMWFVTKENSAHSTYSLFIPTIKFNQSSLERTVGGILHLNTTLDHRYVKL